MAIKPKNSPATVPAAVKKSPKGFDVDYTLPTPGEYTVQVACDKYPLDGPYRIEAVPANQQVPPKGTQPAKVASPTIIPGQPIVPVVAAHNAALLKSNSLKEPVPLHTGTVAPMQIASPQMKTPVKRSAETGPLQAPIKPKMARPEAIINYGIVPMQAGAQQQAQPMVPGGQNQSGTGPYEPGSQHPAGPGTHGPGSQNPSGQPSGREGQPEGLAGAPREAGQLVNAPEAIQGKYQPDPLFVEPVGYRNPRLPILPEEKVHTRRASLSMELHPQHACMDHPNYLLGQPATYPIHVYFINRSRLKRTANGLSLIPMNQLVLLRLMDRVLRRLWLLSPLNSLLIALRPHLVLLVSPLRAHSNPL